MNTAKATLLFFAGFAIGAASGYFVLKRKLEKEKSEELEVMREVYERDLAKMKAKVGEETKHDILTHLGEKKEEEGGNEQEDITAELTEEEKKFWDDEKPNYIPAEIKEMCKSSDEAIRPIEIISRDEFGTASDEYDKIDLEYFEADGVLSEDGDGNCDIPSTIGYDALKAFGEIDEDEPDVVYVRNNRIKAVFDVKKISGSYDDYYDHT